MSPYPFWLKTAMSLSRRLVSCRVLQVVPISSFMFFEMERPLKVIRLDKDQAVQLVVRKSAMDLVLTRGSDSVLPPLINKLIHN